MGINRKRIYYRSIKDRKDLEVLDLIEKTLIVSPAYGHKRLAIDLGYGKNKVLRIMHKFGIKPPRRKIKHKYLTKSVSNHSYANLIKTLLPASLPSQILVTDLTYLKYQNSFIYLATVEDIFTKEVMGAELSDKHDSHLALKAIQNAVTKNKQIHGKAPDYFHSDQGSEFMAQIVTGFLEQNNIKISVSDKGSPWQNGYKESFFDKLKTEIGDINRFETLGEVIEEIYSYIYYYNNLRIHTTIKMAPTTFRRNYIENVSRKSGT